MRTINKLALALGVFLGAFGLTLFAQTASQGGAFLPTQNYTVTGLWTMTGGATMTGPVNIAAPVLSGSVTGTYTLAGTPTFTSPTLTSPTVSSGTLTLRPTTNQLTIGAATHTTIFSVTAPSASSRTLTFPDPAGADSVAYLALSQALTNKTYNGNTWTAGTGTLTIAAAKTLTASNTLTLAGTDSTTQTFQATSGTVTNAVPTFQSSGSLGGSPVTLTAAQCGQAFNLDAATGVVYILPSTLPAAGCTYDFRVTVSVTSNAHEIESGNAAHFFTGDPIMIAASATLATAMCDGSSAIAYKSNGTTTGGLIGSRYRVTVQSATGLLIEGINAGSGSLATACSASN